MGAMKKAIAIVQLMRPENSVAAIYTLLGAYLATATGSYLTPATGYAALTVMLIVAYGCVINDYKDVEVDRADKPYRPIPSGRITPRTALLVALVLAFAAQGIAWQALGTELAMFALSTILLSTAYSFFWKSTLLLGNITIAFLVSSILIFGGLVVHGLPLKLWIASFLVFIYILAQEILCTVKDSRGDKLAGLQTTANVLGEAKTIHLFQLLAIGFSLVAIAPWIFRLTTVEYLFAVILCTVVPLVGVATLLAIRVTEFTVNIAVYTIWIARLFSIIPILLLK
jgi:geranylgeranylglycerol-phosphate geranylgeranyltransferase